MTGSVPLTFKSIIQPKHLQMSTLKHQAQKQQILWLAQAEIRHADMFQNGPMCLVLIVRKSE